MSPEQRGPSRAEDAEMRSPIPLRATGIVLAAWVLALVFAAVVVVPIIFASCFPTTQNGGGGP